MAMPAIHETDADGGSAVSGGDVISACISEHGFSAAAFLEHGAVATGRTIGERSNGRRRPRCEGGR